MRLCIRGYWGIGDILLQTPAIALARKLFPEAHITHYTMEVPLRGQDSLLRGNPAVDELDPEPPVQADVTINLGGYEYYNMEDLARYHRDFSHTHIFVDMLLQQLVGSGMLPKDIPPIDLTRALYPVLYLTETDVEFLDQLSLHSPCAVLCRATKGCPQKTWPVDKWQQLAHELHERGYQVVTVGVDGDFHFDCADIDLVGRLGFRETAALQLAADVYIGHGDGLIMSAYALCVPFVCIWGSFADPAHYFDLSRSDVQTVGHVLDCSYRFTRDYEDWRRQTCLRGTCECIRDVEVTEVLEALSVLEQRWSK